MKCTSVPPTCSQTETRATFLFLIFSTQQLAHFPFCYRLSVLIQAGTSTMMLVLISQHPTSCTRAHTHTLLALFYFLLLHTYLWGMSCWMDTSFKKKYRKKIIKWDESKRTDYRAVCESRRGFSNKETVTTIETQRGWSFRISSWVWQIEWVLLLYILYTIIDIICGLRNLCCSTFVK